MRVPRSTYRLQLGPDLDLADAARLVGYLAELGISDIYASPILTPPEGATHGYHIVDPTRINPAIGGDEGLRELAEAMDEHGLGMLLDIVPNHLAATTSNPWWRDVLTHGPASAYAAYFDIDWAANGGRLVLPVLGSHLDEVLTAGQLDVVVEDGEPHLAYHEERFPLALVTRDRAREVQDSPSIEALRALHDAQHYELTYWRAGVERMNYRRFFDITDLVGVRVEDREVFDRRHRRILELVADGTVTGLRVDHIDGLRDPQGYLDRLQETSRDAAGTDTFYVVVEKILEGDEPLPGEWPVAGTTGYELLNAISAALVHRAGLTRMDGTYSRFTGQATAAAAVLHERKLAVLDELFRGEVTGLVQRLTDLAARIPEVPSLSPEDLRAALVAVTASFGVYRTYIRDIGPLRPDDRARLERAFADVRSRHAALDRSAALIMLERVFMMDVPVGLADDVRRDWLDVVMRWQQLTGPAMAKGFEDTTFYIVNRLISLNEVGVDADGMDDPHGVDGFHERTAVRARTWPHTMNATSTHDTKRSEDVRARLHVLTEMPDVWAETVRELHDLAAAHRTQLVEHTAPDANEEWLIWQSLVGMWPVTTAEEVSPPRVPAPPAGIAPRLAEFALKAAREAKVHTSWLDRNEDHEAALRRFVESALADGDIVAGVRDVVDRVALPGVTNSLAQVTVKLLAPGVPDVYQGSELWDWSLVDPDNRRPVDHEHRRDLLGRIVRSADGDRATTAQELLGSWRDGRVKMFINWALLQLRRDEEDLLRDGDYLPLPATGEHAAHVIAFARRRDDHSVTCIVPRLPLTLAGEERWATGDRWGDTSIALPSGTGTVREAITGRALHGDGDTIRLADALGVLPVAAVLHR